MIFFRILIISCFLLLIWFIGFVYFVGKIPQTEPTLPEKADAIIVLTGARGRIDAGLILLSGGCAEKLFISGVGQKADLADLSQYLVSFPAQKTTELKSSITLGHFASSTEENAIESLEWINQHNYKKIILVTSNYHMPRSLYLFERSMPNIVFIPYHVIRPGSPWQSSSSFKVTFLEYNKLLLSLCK